MRSASAQRALAAALLAAIASSASAQVVLEPPREGGQHVVGVIAQSFEADSNFALDPDDDDTSFFATTTLGLGYFTSTRTQSFSLVSDVEVRALQRDGDDVELIATLPSLALAYARENAGSSVETQLRFREVSLRARRGEEGGFTPAGFVAPGDLSPEGSDGFRQDYGGNVTLRFGQNGPVSSEFSLGVDRSIYRDTDDDALDDSLTGTISTSFAFQISPVLTGTYDSTATLIEIDSDDDDTRRIAFSRAGLEYEASQTLLLTAGAGYSFDERETTTTLERLEGPQLDAGFVLDLPLGSIGGSAAVLLPNDRGPLVTGSISFEREWQRGSGSAEFALETTSDGDTIGTAAIIAQQELGRGTLSFNLSRTLEVDRDGDNTVVTAAGLGYFREITNRLDFGVEIAAAQSENQDTAGDDFSQFRFSFGFEYELTERANLIARYSHRRESIDEVASGNAISIALEFPFSL